MMQSPSKINIILIHTGNSWYLPYTLWQLKKSNPTSSITLIGDKNNKHLSKWINHIDIKSLSDSTLKLKDVYEHHSKLGESFEYFCIARWFMLHAFMQQHHLERCIYLDSDILVYDDLNRVENNFANYEMTYCGFSAHSNFIKNRKALENYCTNVIDLYTGKFPITLKEKSLYHQVISNKSKMNISDMTFFHDYNLRYPDALLDISLPNSMGTFDRSIEDIRVFEGDNDGFKSVTWEKDKPYCIEKETQNKYPFITLHFQGRGKKLLKNHFIYYSTNFKFIKLKNNFYLTMDKLMNKLKRK